MRSRMGSVVNAAQRRSCGVQASCAELKPSGAIRGAFVGNTREADSIDVED